MLLLGLLIGFAAGWWVRRGWETFDKVIDKALGGDRR